MNNLKGRISKLEKVLSNGRPGPPDIAEMDSREVEACKNAVDAYIENFGHTFQADKGFVEVIDEMSLRERNTAIMRNASLVLQDLILALHRNALGGPWDAKFLEEVRGIDELGILINMAESAYSKEPNKEREY